MYIKMASSEPWLRKEELMHTYSKNVMNIVSILNITTKLVFVSTKISSNSLVNYNNSVS